MIRISPPVISTQMIFYLKQLGAFKSRERDQSEFFLLSCSFAHSELVQLAIYFEWTISLALEGEGGRRINADREYDVCNCNTV